jgi:hypothetical protein
MEKRINACTDDTSDRDPLPSDWALQRIEQLARARLVRRKADTECLHDPVRETVGLLFEPTSRLIDAVVGRVRESLEHEMHLGPMQPNFSADENMSSDTESLAPSLSCSRKRETATEKRSEGSSETKSVELTIGAIGEKKRS